MDEGSRLDPGARRGEDDGRDADREARREEGAALAAVRAALDEILVERTPEPVPTAGCDGELLELVRGVNRLATLLSEREQTLHAEIARRLAAEQALRQERDLLVSGPVVTWRWAPDLAGSVHYVTPNISSLGYQPEEFTAGSRRYADIIFPEDFAWVMEEDDQKTRAGLESWTQEYRVVDAEGAVRWVRDFTRPVRDASGATLSYEGYTVDITPQKQAEAALRRREEQLRMLSLTDDLTGLYNRRGLFALGGHMMRTARRRGGGMGVIFVDLDDLRSINDRLGHAQGDEALRDTAEVLRAGVRESDVLARAGGDEFVVLMEDELETLDELIARIHRRLEAHNVRGGRAYTLRVGVGTTYWEASGPATLQDLIEEAEQRATESKRAGQSD